MVNFPVNPAKGLSLVFAGILVLLFTFGLLDLQYILILIGIYLIVRGLLQFFGIYALRKFLQR